MLAQTHKVKDASGKGFDSEDDARQWVREYVLEMYPPMIKAMDERRALFAEQLSDALSSQSP